MEPAWNERSSCHFGRWGCGGLCDNFAPSIVEILIESAIAAYAGILMMSFGPSVYTRDFAIAQFRYAMSVGMKRFMMQLIAGIGASLVMDWSNAAKAGTGPLSWQVIAMMIGAPIVLLRLTQTIPAMAQGMIMGTHIGSHGSTRQHGGFRGPDGSSRIGGSDGCWGSADRIR
jgi:type IV secretion system protein TrbL